MYRKLARFSAILMLCFILLYSHFLVAQAPSVRVVVNNSVMLEELSLVELKQIFSMRKTQWADGQTISVFVLTNQHEAHQTFSTSLLGMFPYQLDRIWNKLVYSGLGEEPTKVKNEQIMIERISQQPGAIGYIVQQGHFDGINVIDVVEE